MYCLLDTLENWFVKKVSIIDNTNQWWANLEWNHQQYQHNQTQEETSLAWSVVRQIGRG